MNIWEQLTRATLGFSGKRVGYALSIVSLALIPLHFFVSCEGSGIVAGMAFFIFGVTIIFSLVNPPGTLGRFYPIITSLIALIGHSLCTH